jgi:putative membrane protein insertion efficiency factor
VKGAEHILILVVRLYRLAISPVLAALFSPLGLGCRFHPTCSRYALEAIQSHGALKGAWLTARRLGRCHPWGGSGEDPVPPAAETGRRGAPSALDSLESAAHSSAATGSTTRE